MACERCGQEDENTALARTRDRDPLSFGARKRWCGNCDVAYDEWSRQFATDVVWEVLSGMVVVLGFGIGLPLLGASVLASVGGVFVGFGTIIGLHRFNQRRRRRQFLDVVPRAYLPGKT